MTTWDDFERAQPEMARRGHELIYRSGEGEGLLITVREGVPPRAHPVNAGVIDGHFYTFVQGKSAKRRDLDEDGRYAFHAHVAAQEPSEFLVRGHASLVTDAQTRAGVAGQWFWTPDDAYPLYELLIDNVLLGERPTPNDYPPIYSHWSATD
jgi:hypothetical protein